jgi:hypothetical protein
MDRRKAGFTELFPGGKFAEEGFGVVFRKD